MYIASEKMFHEERENMRGGKGPIEFNHLFEDGAKLPSKCRVYAKITVPPGSTIGDHDHVDETEFYYILSGEGIVSDSGQRIRVSAGDVIMTGDVHSHGVENHAVVDLVMLATIVMD